MYFHLIKSYSEHIHVGQRVSVWHRLHCYSTGLIYLYAYIFCRIFTTWFLLVLYLAYIAHNAMPTKEISTKCNVFLQLMILRPHPHFTRHVRKKKSAKPSAFYTFENPQIRKSAFYRRPKKEARSTKGLEWRFWVRNGAVHRMGELSWMVLTSGGYTVFNSLLSLY